MSSVAQRGIPILLVALLSVPTAWPASFDFRALVAARGALATGPPSWLEQNYGRLEFGGEGIGERRAGGAAVADLGVDWEPTRYFLLHAHGVVRAEPSSYAGERAGLVAAFAQAHLERGAHRLQLRAGQFFLPTSRENTGDLWSSPYTITFSAWNTWVGQEVRPIGLDLEYRFTTTAQNRWTIAATAFQGNDTMGTLLAWRGWTLGNRLSVYGEVVPLPPLWSLPVFIPAQRRDGSTAVGPDLDRRTGYAARVRYSYADRGLIQFMRLDNRGDNELYVDEYSWETDFNHLAMQWGDGESTLLALEAAQGITTMGPVIPQILPRRAVNAGYFAAYLLGSHKRGDNRFSARFDSFRQTDRDGRGENNDEDGLAWTLAYFRDLTPSLRAGIEFTQVSGDRPAAEESGFDARTDGQSVIVEIRYSFR